MDDEAIGSLSARLQQAAIDPARWPDTLDAVSKAAGGTGAVLFSTNRHQAVLSSPSQQETVDGYLRGGWDVRDERYRGVPLMLRNGVVTEDDFIDADSIRRSAYYRDFLERYKLRWFAGLGFSLGGEFWCVSVQRRIDQGPFHREEVGALKRLLVPIHDAATISQKLGAVHVTGMLDALELLAQPGLVCDDRARIVAINGAAEKLFSASIDPSSRELRLRDSRSQARLEAVLKSALAGDARLPREAATMIRDASGIWRKVRAVALRSWIAPFLCDARVLLLLPPNAPPGQELAALRVSLDLTGAEAALAHELASGSSIRGAAEKLDITYETARSYLKIIFSKTGVHRQAELVALLTKLGC